MVSSITEILRSFEAFLRDNRGHICRQAGTSFRSPRRQADAGKAKKASSFDFSAHPALILDPENCIITKQEHCCGDVLGLGHGR